jgi:hypothetical protein
VYVFFRGPTNDLRYVRRSAGQWSESLSLGGTIAGSPAAAVDGDGDLVVAVLNANGLIWYRTLSGGSWSSWSNRSGQLDGRITLASHEGDVVLLGTNSIGQPWATAWDGSTDSWLPWSPLGGAMTPEIGAASFGGSLYTFALDVGGHTFYATFDAGSWGSWTALGGTLQQGLAATSSSSQTFVFGTNYSGRVFQRNSAGSAWASWTSLSGTLATGPEAAATSSQVYVFANSSGGQTFYRRWNGSIWTAWTSLGGTLALE